MMVAPGLMQYNTLPSYLSQGHSKANKYPVQYLTSIPRPWPRTKCHGHGHVKPSFFNPSFVSCPRTPAAIQGENLIYQNPYFNKPNIENFPVGCSSSKLVSFEPFSETCATRNLAEDPRVWRCCIWDPCPRRGGS